MIMPTEQNVVEEVFRIAELGLDGALTDAHDTQSGISVQQRLIAQGKKDAYRVVLATIRQAPGFDVASRPARDEYSDGCPFCGHGASDREFSATAADPAPKPGLREPTFDD